MYGKKMMGGGMAAKKDKMHRMPDGTMMKNSDHKGSTPQKLAHGGMATKGCGMAKPQKFKIY